MNCNLEKLHKIWGKIIIWKYFLPAASLSADPLFRLLLSTIFVLNYFEFEIIEFYSHSTSIQNSDLALWNSDWYYRKMQADFTNFFFRINFTLCMN